MNTEVEKVYWILFLAIILLLIIYLYVQNYRHKTTKYTIHLPKVKGKKIVFLSDTNFQENTSLAFLDRIIVDIEQISPDVILFGGGIIHKLNQEKILEQTKDFFYQLNKIAPTYVIYGEQDLANSQLNEIKRVLKLSGATVLHNEAEWISFGDTTGFWLMGLCEKTADLARKDNPLEKITLSPASEAATKILIAHQPKYFMQYLQDEQTRPNLILSGHTLGGQVVLPRVGGVYAPNQGLHPVYDFGIFTSDQYPESRMIITSGVGNAHFPLRINNRPEIVLIELE